MQTRAKLSVALQADLCTLAYILRKNGELSAPAGGEAFFACSPVPGSNTSRHGEPSKLYTNSGISGLYQVRTGRLRPDPENPDRVGVAKPVEGQRGVREGHRRIGKRINRNLSRQVCLSPLCAGAHKGGVFISSRPF